MKQKLLLILVGILCSLGTWADETLFSYEFGASIAKNAVIEQTDGTMTMGVSEATAYKANTPGETGAKFKEATDYIKVSLTGKKFAAGDKINISVWQGGTSSAGSTYGLYINTANNSENAVYEYSMSSLAKKTIVVATYTITSTDALNGTADFYILGKFPSGKNIYVEKIEAVRPSKYSVICNTATNGSVTSNAATEGVYEGTTVTLTTTPATGYELASLIVQDADKNDVNVTNNTFTMPASNVTVSATFRVVTVKCEISYNAGGGKGTIESTNASIDDKITLPACTFTYDGYTFTGWKNGSTTYAAGDEYTVTGATTFTAQWNKATGSIIKATLKGGTSADMSGALAGSVNVSTQSDKKFASGSFVGLTLIDGSTFHTGDVLNVNIEKVASGSGTIALYTSSDGADMIYNTTIAGVVGDNKITLPADINEKSSLYICRTSSNGWNAYVNFVEVTRPIYHTITYTNTKDVDNLANPTQYAEGDGVTEFTALADVTGFKFTGWSPSSISATATTDQTITAQWAAAYTVTFNMNNHGTAIASQGVISGEKATKPADPSDGAYTFGGWYTEAACTNAFDFTTTITENKELFAKWTAKPASKSINIELNILDNSKKWDFSTALKNANITYVDNDALDSLDASKTASNEPFLGLKFKKATSSFTIVLEAGSKVNVKFGNIGNTINVSGLTTATIATDAEKTYSFTATEAGYLTFSNSTASTVVLKQIMIDEDIKELSIPYYKSASITLAAQDEDDNYWSTLSNDAMAVFIPSSNAEVKKASVSNGVLTLTNLETESVTISGSNITGYFVPKSAGVIIKSTSNNVTYYTAAGKSVDALTNNMLYPGTGAKITSPTNCKYFMLAYASSAKDNLGFYYGAADGAAFESRAGGAYLAVPTSNAGAKTGFAFNDDISTGISAVENYENVETPAAYNIAGQRVNANAKGIVIINGKKYFNK